MTKMHTKLYLLVVPCSLANIIWHIILQLLPRTTSTLRPVLGLKFKRISHKYPYTSNVWANAGYFPVIKEKRKKSMRGNSKWDINVQHTLILSEVQGSAVAHYSSLSLTGRYITKDNHVLDLFLIFSSLSLPFYIRRKYTRDNYLDSLYKLHWLLNTV